MAGHQMDSVPILNMELGWLLIVKKHVELVVRIDFDFWIVRIWKNFFIFKAVYVKTLIPMILSVIIGLP